MAKSKTKTAPAVAKTYTVTFERTVRFVAEVEVDATNSMEAEQLAKLSVDAPRANYWRETDVVDERTLSVTPGRDV